MTRSQAIAEQAPRYQGKPCKQCSETERYTSTGQCVACAATRSRTDHQKRYQDQDWVERHRAQSRQRQVRNRLNGLEFVYECYSSEGELLYVGRTCNPTHRMRNHQQDKPWFAEVAKVAWTQYPNQERQRISGGAPKYNKHGI